MVPSRLAAVSNCELRCEDRAVLRAEGRDSRTCMLELLCLHWNTYLGGLAEWVTEK
jgi:hypothetical protein